MKNILLSNYIIKQLINFSSFYREYKVKQEKVTSVRYRIITTLNDFKKSNLIQLAFFDNPGDLLAPMSIGKIKQTPDLIENMHPIDINSINDLYYLSKDKVTQITIRDDNLIALTNNGEKVSYKISENINPDAIDSTRIAYMIGYMQAEKVMQKAYAATDKYKIIKDNITTLEISDLNTEKIFLKNPLDILFSDDYKNFSKEDIARIGYICGQMSQV